jgi:tripartite-type tricarboxylate transporter receptor subunit TctC
VSRAHIRRSSILFAWLATAWSALFSAAATAQSYPSRPVTVIVPFAAGGPVDTDTRKYAARLSEMIGQPVVVDYKPGAGTSIGAAYVAKAKADGYTLLSDSSAFAVFPAFYKDLTFDPMRDLVPITMMSELVSVLMVPSSSPIKSFSEYLAYTRANPGKLSYGTSGVGDISHLSAAWMHSIAATKVTFVPYKGNGPMMVDLLAGRMDAGSASLVQALPHIRSGKLRALAIRGASRVKPLPDVPAVNEHPGMKEFASVNWLGFFAPAGIPAPVIDKLSSALVAVSRLPDVVADLESQASTPIGNTPAEFKALVAEEIARWKKVVAETGIGQ